MVLFLKRMRAALTALVMLLTLFSFQAKAEDPSVEITIFFTQDVHGRVTHEVGMGYAMAAGFVNAARTKGGNVLLLDAGGAFHGSNIATVSKGAGIVKIMNAMGYNAMTLGNHDYNYGLEQLITLSAEAEFPMLSCNTLNAKGELAFEPYSIQEIAGKRIAIIGVQAPEIMDVLPQAMADSFSISDGIEAVKAAVAQVADQADAVIVLAHMSQNGQGADGDAYAAIEGVNLVIEGNSQRLAHGGEQVGDALVVSAGEYLKYLGKVTMCLDSAGVTMQVEWIPTPDVYPSETIEQAIEATQATQRVLLDEVVGQTDVRLNGDRADVRTQETNLGNLVCDAVRQVTGADIVVIKASSIRASIEPGAITRSHIVNTLPFGNYVVVKQVKGSALRAAIELALGQYPEPSPDFLQISGMSVRFDPAHEPGQRVMEVLVGGVPMADDTDYDVAMLQTQAYGTDVFAMLAEGEVLVEYSSLDEVFMAFLKSEESVAPVVDGRIVPVK